MWIQELNPAETRQVENLDAKIKAKQNAIKNLRKRKLTFKHRADQRRRAKLAQSN